MRKSASDRKIDRWQQTIVPPAKRPEQWSTRAGGSWDMYEVAPIPDAMLAELMQRHHTAGAPWNCRSLPLSMNDREYMYLLYYSMIGLVARMRAAEKRAAELEPDAMRWRELMRQHEDPNDPKESFCIARWDARAEHRYQPIGGDPVQLIDAVLRRRAELSA